MSVEVAEGGDDRGRMPIGKCLAEDLPLQHQKLLKTRSLIFAGWAAEGQC